MYRGVPMIAPGLLAPGPPSTRAMPKSVTIARPAVTLEEDVVGLDVAVNHAVPMRVRERPRDLLRQANRVRDAERTAAPTRADNVSPSMKPMTKNARSACSSTE